MPNIQLLSGKQGGTYGLCMGVLQNVRLNEGPDDWSWYSIVICRKQEGLRASAERGGGKACTDMQIKQSLALSSTLPDTDILLA
jgi:hypothetical protein